MSHWLSIVYFSATAHWPQAGLVIYMLNKDSILRVFLILHIYDKMMMSNSMVMEFLISL